MPNSVDFSGRPFHFIGIGGIGMSALAYILARRKLPVYGSDVQSNHITGRLQDLGAHIFWRQEASNLGYFQPRSDSPAGSSPSLAPEGEPLPIKAAVETLQQDNGRNGVRASSDLPQVICSSAIQTNNAEYRAARELGCPIFHRSDLLAALIQDYKSIAVAGTHGKTTTSSLIGFLLLKASVDPTIVVGGEVAAWEGNARLGQGDYLVAEADESDGSLVKFAPHIGVITNIELDHPDRYESLDAVVEVFTTFSKNCQTAIGCIDCALVRDLLQPQISYSLNPATGADYSADRVSYSAAGTTARIWERGNVLGQLDLQLLGKHNLSNALAAVAVGRAIGLEFDAIATAIAQFEGARRRFEYRGIEGGIAFVDDYAHHPSEIRATLAAARLRVDRERQDRDRGRLVAIFQPHRPSRTRAFLSDFAQAFGDADIAIVTDIYTAGESNPDRLSGEQVAEEIAAHHSCVYYRQSLEAVTELLVELLRPGDFALFLGAGNLNRIIPDVMTFHRKADIALSPHSNHSAQSA